ncbi:glycoside hydrolase family protein [Fibrella musci]|uniref:glycoside hydrolase family protein n=1 Tax=Fibrella musci TaxID=3242485 RepID=UPI00351FF756
MQSRFQQTNRRLATSQSRFITSRQPYSTAKFIAGCAHTRPYTPPPRNPADEQQKIQYRLYVANRLASVLFQECVAPEAVVRAYNVLAEAAYYTLQQIGAAGNVPAPSGDGAAWFDAYGQVADQLIVGNNEVDGRIPASVRQAVDTAFRDRYVQAKQGQTAAQSLWRDISPVGYNRAFSVNNLSVSSAGVDFVKQFEGFSSSLYNDPAGHCTIGYGHLVHRGNCNGSESAEFRAGITEARGTELLRDSLRSFETSVNTNVKVTLNQAQFDSLVSFSYNVGTGAFQSSTLLKKLNTGDYAAVPTEMKRWVNGGGKVLPGLVRRREAEGNLFSSGSYSTTNSWRMNGYGGAFGDAVLDDIESGEREDGGMSFSASATVPAYCPINTASSASSAHFSQGEFESHDGVAIPTSILGNVQNLMNQLEVLRAEVGVPIKVVSGYRSPGQNASVGGKSQSRHMCGQAADIQVRDMTPPDVHATIERLIAAGKMQQGGLGLYNTFVHYDTRGTKARWNG